MFSDVNDVSAVTIPGGLVPMSNVNKIFKMAAPAIDMELKKAFEDLQMKMIETQQQLKIGDMQIDQQRKQQQHAKLTQFEIASLPEETKLYQGIGRMFLLQDKSNINSMLETKIKNSEEKIRTLESNKTYYKKKQKESEDNIREMVAQKQAAKS